jgi:hypothetical protein
LSEHNFESPVTGQSSAKLPWQAMTNPTLTGPYTKADSERQAESRKKRKKDVAEGDNAVYKSLV